MAVFLLICHIRLKYSTIERKQLEKQTTVYFFYNFITYIQEKSGCNHTVSEYSSSPPFRVSVSVRGWGYDISVVEWQSELESGCDWVSGLYVTGTYTASNYTRMTMIEFSAFASITNALFVGNSAIRSG